MVRMRALFVLGLLLVLAPGRATTQPQTDARAPITSPRQQFGAAIGDDYFLATFTQLDAYW